MADLLSRYEFAGTGGFIHILVDEIIFKGKRKIDWKEVEKYLKSYIGKKFLANELEELVYIGTEYGWYRCTVRFAIPTCDEHNRMVGRNYYQGRMLIRHDANGKKYLYDIVDIKKET